MHTLPALWQRFLALKAEQPGLRIRDAAHALHVREVQLVAADPAARRLRPDWPALLAGLATLGDVMALTRNEACVHETTGHYGNVSFEGKVGLAINPVIDVRIFLFHWESAFAVTSETPRGTQRSLQFFDRHGDAVHKVYLTARSDVAAFETLCDAFAAPGDATPVPVARTPLPQDKPDSEIDLAAFHAGWAALDDVHAFHPFLRRFGVSRRQAFRLAPAGQAWQVDKGAVRQLLEDCAAAATPIMVFAGNSGMIQIHTGPVANVKQAGAWLNILDPQFNLHLRLDLIHEAWVTRKPGDQGVVTSLELFDAEGTSLVTFFGERKPGRPERAEWVAHLAALPVRETADAA